MKFLKAIGVAFITFIIVSVITTTLLGWDTIGPFIAILAAFLAFVATKSKEGVDAINDAKRDKLIKMGASCSNCIGGIVSDKFCRKLYPKDPCVYHRGVDGKHTIPL